MKPPRQTPAYPGALRLPPQRLSPGASCQPLPILAGVMAGHEIRLESCCWGTDGGAASETSPNSFTGCVPDLAQPSDQREQNTFPDLVPSWTCSGNVPRAPTLPRQRDLAMTASRPLSSRALATWSALACLTALGPAASNLSVLLRASRLCWPRSRCSCLISARSCRSARSTGRPQASTNAPTTTNPGGVDVEPARERPEAAAQAGFLAEQAEQAENNHADNSATNTDRPVIVRL